MHLSITSDFAADTGCPEAHLERIAAAGFSHVHWCHQWNTDFLYDPAEIDQVARWLGSFDLQLLDLHASSGREKGWASLREYERLAGVALVRNRIDFVSQVGSDTIVMHTPSRSDAAAWDRLCRIIAGSSYRKCVSMESNVHREENKDPDDFLRRAFAAGRRIAGMIASAA